MVTEWSRECYEMIIKNRIRFSFKDLFFGSPSPSDAEYQFLRPGSRLFLLSAWASDNVFVGHFLLSQSCFATATFYTFVNLFPSRGHVCGLILLQPSSFCVTLRTGFKDTVSRLRSQKFYTVDTRQRKLLPQLHQ